MRQSSAADGQAFRRDLQACAGCVDVAFTAPLLRTWNPDIERELQLPNLCKFSSCEVCSEMWPHSAHCRQDAVEKLTWPAPELLVFLERRYKSPGSCRRDIGLTTLVSEHMHLKARIMQHTMPTKRQIAQIQRQVGRKRKGRSLFDERDRDSCVQQEASQKAVRLECFLRDKLRETKRSCPNRSLHRRTSLGPVNGRGSAGLTRSMRVTGSGQSMSKVVGTSWSQRPLEAAAARKRRLRCNPSSAGSVLPDVAPDSHPTEHLQHIAGEAESWVIFELVTLNNNLNNII